MTEKFRATDATEWNSHGNIGRGKVRKKLTARTLLKGHAVAKDDGADEATPPQAEAEGEAAPRPGPSRPHSERR